MDEKGIPNIAMMVCEASDEPSGVEITLPVKGKDIITFRDRTAEVCTHAQTIPKFEGEALTISKREFSISGNGWRRYKTPGWNKPSYAIIGGIAYLIDRDQLSDEAHQVAAEGFCIDVPIGAVELSLSREALSYDPKTIEYLNGRFETIRSEVEAHYRTAINSATSYWDKCVVYCEFKSDSLVRNTGMQFYHRKKAIKGEFRVTGNDAYAVNITSAKELASGKFFHRRGSGRTTVVIPKPCVVVVWNDTTSFRVKPKYETLLTKVDPNATLVIVKTPSKRKFKQLWATLGGCPKVIHLNSLPDAAKVASTDELVERSRRDKGDLKRKVRKFDKHSYGSTFCDAEIDFATKDTVYYMYAKDRQMYDASRDVNISWQEIARCLRNLKDLGVCDVYDHAIYAIPLMYSCHMENKSNFVNVLDVLRKLDLPPSVLKDAALYENNDAANVKTYASSLHSKLLVEATSYSATNLCATVSRLYAGYKDATSAYNKWAMVRDARALVGEEGLKLPEVKAKKEIDLGMYPMLQLIKAPYYLAKSDYETIATYIQNQENRQDGLSV